MKVEFDPEKRALTLAERGLDFLDAPLIFDDTERTLVSSWQDYGEVRYVTYGTLGELSVVVVWTERNEVRRIISMRRMHAKEVENVRLDRSR